MAPEARALDPEELLARSGWMRSLVRGIVLDDGADDVVQDAWVAALERPGAGREPGGLAAWLAAVARNLARRRRRRAAVREAVERAGARSERLDGPAEEVERMQLQRQLADAVLALDEPQRSAVILRHLDGCSATEIARRQGCSVEAARQRVSRGLAQLRSRLDRDLGGSANRCLVLAPWLGKSWSGALAAGGVAVGTKAVIGVAGAALTAAALFVVLSDGDSSERKRHGAPDTAEAASPERTEAALPAAVLAEVDTATNARSEAASAPPNNREALPGAILVRGRVTDTLGEPIEGAELRIGDVAVRSAANGRFDVELAPSSDRAVEGHVAHEGYLPVDVTLDPAHFLDLRLQALPALQGLLVDGQGRAVAPPGYVKAHGIEPSGAVFDREAKLEGDGSYRLQGLPLGRLTGLEARARGFATTKAGPDLALEADATSRLDIALVPGATVTGIVLDSESREPLPGAAVWLETFDAEEDSVHPSTKADENGRFRLHGAEEDVRSEEDGPRVSFWLMARAEGHVASPVRGYSSAVSDEHAYDFELLLERATGELEILVLLPDRRPASVAVVWLIDSQGNPSFETTDSEGFHVFEGLPAGKVALWITDRVAGETRTVIGRDGVVMPQDEEGPPCALRAELELAPGERRSEEFVLQAPEQVVEGRVTDPLGRPVSGLRVEAAFVLQLGYLAVSSGSDSTTTGADGRYRFDRLHIGKYSVSPAGEHEATACSSPGNVDVVLGEGQEPRDVDFVVGPCLTIEGRIEAGGDPSELELEARDPRTGERHSSTRPEADGTFRFDALVARDYEVVLLRGEKVLDRASAGPSLATGLVLRAP